jgi:hypothetical protein
VGKRQRVVVRLLLGGLIILGLQRFVLPVAAQQTAAAENSVLKSADTWGELPDSPGASSSKPTDSFQSKIGQAVAAPSTEIAQNQSPQTQTPVTETQQPAPQKPVGTAAAEAPNASGVAASQPAGIAMAPAKQRRVRTIVIRVGAIVGAGVAVGSVVALTAGTSSKPPGAR